MADARTRPLDASPTHSGTLSRPIYGSPQPGLRELVDEGVAHVRGHARLVEQVLDSDLNLSFNLGLDVEAKPDEQLEVVTEGYLHTKFVQLEEGHAISNKTVGRSRQPRESERARTHAR